MLGIEDGHLTVCTHGFFSNAITALFVGTSTVMFASTFVNRRTKSSSLAYEKKIEVLDSIVRRSKSVGRLCEVGRSASIGTLGITIWSVAVTAWIPRMVMETRGYNNVAKHFIVAASMYKLLYMRREKGNGQSGGGFLGPDAAP